MKQNQRKSIKKIHQSSHHYRPSRSVCVRSNAIAHHCICHSYSCSPCHSRSLNSLGISAFLLLRYSACAMMGDDAPGGGSLIFLRLGQVWNWDSAANQIGRRGWTAIFHTTFNVFYREMALFQIFQRHLGILCWRWIPIWEQRVYKRIKGWRDDGKKCKHNKHFSKFQPRRDFGFSDFQIMFWYKVFWAEVILFTPPKLYKAI